MSTCDDREPCTGPDAGAVDYCEREVEDCESARSGPVGLRLVDGGCCYDADASNSSSDFPDSHSDLSQDRHTRGFGEAAARGAGHKSGVGGGGGFFPISEETVFPDASDSGAPDASARASSPADSWVLYSNSSSDDCSFGAFGAATSGRDFKRNRQQCDTTDEEDELSSNVSHMSVGKRLRVNDSAARRVDVRMIDFAHTSFANRSGGSPAVHHGPDGGFLTGLDSLSRLLREILAEAK